MEIKELIYDEAFKTQIESAEDLEAVAKLFNEKGIQVSAAELKSAIEEENGELNENNLENVAGGSLIAAWKQFIRLCQHQGSSGAWHSGGGRHG